MLSYARAQAMLGLACSDKYCTHLLLRSCIYYGINTFILQVTVPVALKPRSGHSAVIFGSGPKVKIIVLFGGLYNKLYLTDTTLLLLGKYTVYIYPVPDYLPHMPI